MKKLIVALVGFIFVIAFGACNTSGEAIEASTSVTTVQSTDTPFILPTSTMPVIPVTVSVTPITFTSAPEVPYVLSYEDCSSGWASDVRGNWALCSGFENPITIMNVSGKRWKFSYNSYYGKDVGDLCTRLHHLTRDGVFLYFSLDPDCELIEPGFVLSISMFRMNLLNGEVVETLKTVYDFETNNGDYYSISISPTGRRLAYIYPQKSPLILSFLDLQTGENRSYRIEERYVSGGSFAWSEDGTKLAFMLESEKDFDYFISMVFLDLLKNNSMVTFINDKDYLWISSRLEVLNDVIKITPSGLAPLFYDIETGNLRSINQ